MKPTKRQKRIRRHNRVRAKVHGTQEVPRLSVFRSNRHLAVQIIDDHARKTLLSMTDIVEAKTRKTGTKSNRAEAMGETMGQKAVAAGISKVVFDRGGYKYHGRVRSLAEGLRKGGLQF